MSQFELKLPAYEGPLPKLLELIEARTLDITQLSLAAVTDDFLKYLENLADVPPAILADFIVVASRLILIKSKSLLPSLPLSEEEEEDIRDLESRLVLYQKLKSAEQNVEAHWHSEGASASRPYFMEFSGVSVFYPGRNTTKEALKEAILGLYESLRKLNLETETITDKMVSLEEKMKEIVGRMQALAETSLRTLSAGASRSDVVVAFLAVLHLAREQLVRLEQSGHFSDIIIRKSAPAEPEPDLAEHE
jgi:segregation and condensation protein A